MRADDDEPRLSPVGSTTFSELVARRLGRREALAGIAASAALAAADPFRVSSALAV